MASSVRITSNTSIASCAPFPTNADNSTSCRGARNTSPCTSFHPDSSLTSLSCATTATHHECPVGMFKNETGWKPELCKPCPPKKLPSRHRRHHRSSLPLQVYFKQVSYAKLLHNGATQKAPHEVHPKFFLHRQHLLLVIKMHGIPCMLQLGKLWG